MEEEIKQSERPDSCKISINAKGQYSGEIKVYAEHIEDAMSKCIAKSNELESLIRNKNGI